jgi:hypothetical protein
MPIAVNSTIMHLNGKNYYIVLSARASPVKNEVAR